MVAGIVLYFVLRARAASTLERVGDVMLEA
jgi:hypothetical protein